MKSRARYACRDEDGFTIMEVMVAAIVLLVGMLGVISLVDTANGVTAQTLGREGGTTLAREMLERARQVPFDSQGASTFGTAVRTSLPDAAATTAVDGSTFTITRANRAVYTATITSCKIDEPADGIGPHDATFCDFNDPPTGGGNPQPGAPTGSSITLKLFGLPISVAAGGALIDSNLCALLGANPLGTNSALDAALGLSSVNTILGLVNSGADISLCPAGSGGQQFALDRTPADFAKVVATVHWTDSGKTNTVVQSTLVPNPGGV